LEELQVENPSVYYAVGVGLDEKSAVNFFWQMQNGPDESVIQWTT
jgi:hypothetical protein